MRHEPLPIGLAQTPRGILISLPPRFWLVVSLRRNFRTLQSEPEAWTYRVPDPSAAVKVERWMAEIEWRLRADARRRAWTATDAEWLGHDAASPVPLASAEIGPALVFTLPSKGVAKATRRLLEGMAAGEVLMATHAAGEGRSVTLAGRRVRASVFERVRAAGFVVPAGDSLFGPEFSQTWRLAPEAATP